MEFRSDCGTTAAGWNASYTSSVPTSVSSVVSNTQNIKAFPNPFTNSTSVSFDLVENDMVTIKLTDILGKETMVPLLISPIAILVTNCPSRYK